ncbi:cytochrome c oxidase subunit II [Paenibacillus turpanensis]|uniref:cytochrome c oxidase subunit II n=1 Tax=Paenibacillus turpanensis TaxID=2689078 RepID=UPI00140C5236|nr:cytochrome c oxidase subunit II [Paenibacillus turpanensis]
MKRWKLTKRLLPLFAAFALLLAGCSTALSEPNPLNPDGPIAKEQLSLMKLSLGIMILVVVVVFVLTLYVLIRFRKRPGQNDIPKQVEGSHKLEIIWTVVPLILLLVLAVPTVQSTFGLAKDYSQDDSKIQVKVTAHQYWWEFEYPQLGIITAQDLVLPANARISFELTSADVKHSFWIPGLAGKMDTNAGLKNKMFIDTPELTENKVYKGKCAELCGASHALMDFKAVVMPEDQFNAWAENLKKTAAVSATAQQGEEVFKAKCLQCHAVNAGDRGFGPNLDGFANREVLAGFVEMNEENLKEWLDNPQAIKPGNNMPEVELNAQELDALAKYLLELK